MMGFFKNLFQIPIDVTYTNIVVEYEEKIRNAQTEEEKEMYTMLSRGYSAHPKTVAKI